MGYLWTIKEYPDLEKADILACMAYGAGGESTGVLYRMKQSASASSYKLFNYYYINI